MALTEEFDTLTGQVQNDSKTVRMAITGQNKAYWKGKQALTSQQPKLLGMAIGPHTSHPAIQKKLQRAVKIATTIQRLPLPIGSRLKFFRACVSPMAGYAYPFENWAPKYLYQYRGSMSLCLWGNQRQMRSQSAVWSCCLGSADPLVNLGTMTIRCMARTLACATGTEKEEWEEIHEAVKAEQPTTKGLIATTSGWMKRLGWEWPELTKFVICGQMVEICDVNDNHWEYLVRESIWRIEGRRDASRRNDMASDATTWDFAQVRRTHDELDDLNRVKIQAMATGSFRCYSRLYKIKQVESPACQLCGHETGNAIHLLWHCPHFEELRRTHDVQKPTDNKEAHTGVPPMPEELWLRRMMRRLEPIEAPVQLLPTQAGIWTVVSTKAQADSGDCWVTVIAHSSGPTRFLEVEGRCTTLARANLRGLYECLRQEAHCGGWKIQVQAQCLKRQAEKILSGVPFTKVRDADIWRKIVSTGKLAEVKWALPKGKEITKARSKVCKAARVYVPNQQPLEENHAKELERNSKVLRYMVAFNWEWWNIWQERQNCEQEQGEVAAWDGAPLGHISTLFDHTEPLHATVECPQHYKPLKGTGELCRLGGDIRRLIPDRLRELNKLGHPRMLPAMASYLANVKYRKSAADTPILLLAIDFTIAYGHVLSAIDADLLQLTKAIQVMLAKGEVTMLYKNYARNWALPKMMYVQKRAHMVSEKANWTFNALIEEARQAAAARSGAIGKTTIRIGDLASFKCRAGDDTPHPFDELLQQSKRRERKHGSPAIDYFAIKQMLRQIEEEAENGTAKPLWITTPENDEPSALAKGWKRLLEFLESEPDPAVCCTPLVSGCILSCKSCGTEVALGQNTALLLHCTQPEGQGLMERVTAERRRVFALAHSIATCAYQAPRPSPPPP